MKFIYNTPIKFNIPSIPFRSVNPAVKTAQGQALSDGFATNPLYEKFGTKA